MSSDAAPLGEADRVVSTYIRLLNRRPARRARPAEGGPLARLFDADDAGLERARQDFIAVASAWTRSSGVGGRILREAGVPAAVLADAGIATISIEESIRQGYGRARFTVRAVAERVGCRTAVVRRVVRADVESGLLEATGVTSGRGRPAQCYTRIRSS